MALSLPLRLQLLLLPHQELHLLLRLRKPPLLLRSLMLPTHSLTLTSLS